MTSIVSTWTAGLCVLSVYSFLWWRDNKFFRVFQGLYVGLAGGYTLGQSLIVLQRQTLAPLIADGNYSVFVPVALGLLLCTTFVKRWSWLSRWSMAFLMGIGAALSLETLETDFIRQVQATLIPWNSLNNAVLVFGTMTGLAYFFFTFTPTKLSGAASKVGRWVLMLSFGTAFGSSVQGRLSLLIAQVQFVLRDWLGVLH